MTGLCEARSMCSYISFPISRNARVAHQRLVVRFGIGDRLDAGQTVGQDVPNGVYVPLFVGYLLELSDPEIRNGHAQAVVEADASVCGWNRDARHAAHLLGDRNGPGTEVVYQRIGQRKVGEGMLVYPCVEILFPSAEIGVSVMMINHRGHPVEPIAVEMKLVEPVFDVRKQEVPHLFLAVIESFGVPVGLFARRTR